MNGLQLVYYEDVMCSAPVSAVCFE